MGVIFIVTTILISTYMKTRVGLKPEEYSNEDLKYSNDPIEKKDSIFTSYLDEMDKLSHITTILINSFPKVSFQNYCLSL